MAAQVPYSTPMSPYVVASIIGKISLSVEKVSQITLFCFMTMALLLAILFDIKKLRLPAIPKGLIVIFWIETLVATRRNRNE